MDDLQIITPAGYFGPSTRSIYFSGPIDYDNTASTIDKLLELDSISSNTITLYINTEGGSLTDSLAIYDTINTLSSPVTTIVNGLCASGGIILCLAGQNRYCTENSLFFYHQPVLRIKELISSDFSEDLAEAYSLSKDLLDDIIKNNTNISKKEWQENFDNKTFKYFPAYKARHWNFVHSIIKNKRNLNGI